APARRESPDQSLPRRILGDLSRARRRRRTDGPDRRRLTLLDDRARPYTVVQLTDLHLLSAPDARLLGIDTALTFEAAIDTAFRGGGIDAVVVTGDIAHQGEPEAYRRARSLLSRYHRGPTMWLPGNHDIEASMQTELPADDAIVLGDWLLLALDTHVDGEEGGYVGSEELERIAGALRGSSAEHVVVFGHHPCVSVGTPWLDT